MDAEALKAMQAKIDKYIEEQGIPHVMPTLEQFQEAGLQDVVDGINLIGGVMRACKVCKKLMLIPRARKGYLNITLPTTGMMYGQKKKSIQVELTDEMKARVDAFRNYSEYKKRKACNDLGKDLFIQEAQEAARAIKASISTAAAESGSSKDGAASSDTKEAASAPPAAAPAPSKPVAPLAERLTYPTLKNPVVLMAGGTEWETVGTSIVKNADSAAFEASLLCSPHIIAGLRGIKVKIIVTSASSAHSLAITDVGACYGWGRNESGQLGLGDSETRPGPVLISSLSKIKCAGVGKEHSLFVTEDGELYSCGSNEHGATGPVHAASRGDSPMLLQGLPKVDNISVGTDFNLVLAEDGNVFSFGWSECGVLGHNEDGQYNQSASSVKMTFSAEKKPKRIARLVDKGVVQISCGIRHCAALGADGTVYTWGLGDYGMLGHGEQKDLWVPTPIPGFQARLIVLGGSWSAAAGWPKRAVSAGGFHGASSSYVYPASSAAFYMWGKVPKGASADSWMYPKPEPDLSGWCITSIGCGKFSVLVSAESNVVGFGGNVAHRELGFGDDGPKTACRPKKVDAVSGLNVAQVACGLGHTLFLVEDGRSAEETKVLEKLSTWTAKAFAPGKRKADDKGSGKAKKSKK